MSPTGGRNFIWAPTDHNHLARLLSSYETVAAQGIQPVTLILLILCESFPGVTAPQLLFDLWKPVPMRERWQHLMESVELLQESGRCVVTGSIGPRTVRNQAHPSCHTFPQAFASDIYVHIVEASDHNHHYGPHHLGGWPCRPTPTTTASRGKHESPTDHPMGRTSAKYVEAPPPWTQGSCSKRTSTQG